ncbi:MAG: DUF6020 family protein [Lachnospiraceae bacterium]|nr:DUF6020 family protein [Lachnospiraceae bacterium]
MAVLEKIKKSGVVNTSNVFHAVFAALFSLMIVFGRHVFEYSGDRGTVDNVYFVDLGWIDFFSWILIGVLVFLTVANFPKLKRECFFYDKRESKGIGALVFSFLTIAVCYVPYVMSFWPGGIYSDTVGSMEIALGISDLTSHEPIGYTMLWKLMFMIAGGSFEPGDYGALYMFTVVQTLSLAVLFAFFIAWLFRRGLKRRFVVIITLVFALFPLFPFYGVSLWKDTVFGIVIFLYSWFLFCLNEKISADNDISVGYLIKYIILSVCVVFFRNNGIYIMIFTSTILVLIYLKNRTLLKKLGITSLAVIIACLVIQHPVFDALELNVDTSIESLSVPIQQTAYIVSTGGKMSDEEAEFIQSVMPLEAWHEIYDPIVVDYIKFDPSFDRGFFNDNVGRFMKVYLGLCLKNPVKAVKAHLLNTMGYWDITKSSSSAYICPTSIPWTGVFQGDYFTYYTKICFQDLVYPQKYLSAAIFAWIAIYALFSLLADKKRKNVLPIVPALALWGTLMIAAPLAFSFRYVFGVFLCTPIYLLCLADRD